MLLRAPPKAVLPEPVAGADGVLGVHADRLHSHAEPTDGVGLRLAPARRDEGDHGQHCGNDCILHFPTTFPGSPRCTAGVDRAILAKPSALRAVS